MKNNIYSFKIFGDSRGSLIPLEEKRNIPFVIKRVYYIYNTKENVRRGYHSHKHLKQILIAVSGSCKIHLDDGREQKEVVLNKPNEGLYLESNIWREMYDFSKDCVLLVLASELYDEKDYIRDYQQFVDYINKKEKK